MYSNIGEGHLPVLHASTCEMEGRARKDGDGASWMCASTGTARRSRGVIISLSSQPQRVKKGLNYSACDSKRFALQQLYQRMIEVCTIFFCAKVVPCGVYYGLSAHRYRAGCGFVWFPSHGRIGNSAGRESFGSPPPPITGSSFFMELSFGLAPASASTRWFIVLWPWIRLALELGLGSGLTKFDRV